MMELSCAVLISILVVLLSTPNTIINLSSCHAAENVCSEREIKALLTFKGSISKDPYDSFSSWDDSAGNKDCCKWNGIICNNNNNKTDHYYRSIVVQKLDLHGLRLRGELNPSLLELEHLNYLDLGGNEFNIFIPPFLGSLKNLRYLNLNGSLFEYMIEIPNFIGKIPPQLGNLTSLRHLDMGYYVTFEEEDHLTVGDDIEWLSHLSSLQYLSMAKVNFSKVSSNWFHTINMLPSLLHLDLSNCDLQSIPSDLHYANFTSLKILDLSNNNFNTYLPKWLYNLSSLVELYLLGNKFQKGISEAIGNLTSLIYLNLSSNELEGEIPNNLGNLCKLITLDFSRNKLQGEIFDGFLGNSSSGCIANNLESLHLFINKLSGPLIPDQLERLKNLIDLRLSDNSFSGSIPSSIGTLSQLETLDLSHNELNGSLPKSLGNLSSLRWLLTMDNDLEGVVTETFFANLTNLEMLGLSSMIVQFSPHWIPPFQLNYLYLSSCHLGPEFPEWIRTQRNIDKLDLSKTGLSGSVPTWFWNISSQCSFLDLSDNQLHGELPDLSESSLWEIYLSSNRFHGIVPRISFTVRVFDLSKNSFSGSISSFLCNPVNKTNNRLYLLDLSRNLLSGELPQCWSYWRSLTLLRLGRNTIAGKIPSSIGSLVELGSLQLQNNYFSGEIPSSLRNCTKLEKIDLGENKLTGTLPIWMGKHFPRLMVLRLRHNNFHDGIPRELCYLTSLQVLDLAHNNLSGSIPRCFSNFSAMALTSKRDLSFINDGDSIIQQKDSDTELVTKGVQHEYAYFLLVQFTMMDLSNNSLSGQIPKALTSLAGLRSLNLSENCLIGKIPHAIGNMSFLESLDFSENRLSGLIPQSIVDLNFLGYLNLSYNNLSGEIPSGTQLQRFSEISYMGNEGLCGSPLKNCNGDKKFPSFGDGQRDVVENDWLEVNGIYISLTLGFVIAFWGFWGVLLVKKSWRYAYFGFLDVMWYKVCNSVNASH